MKSQRNSPADVGAFAAIHDERNGINRRTFCQRALLTSAGLVLVASDVRSQRPEDRQSLVTYPPVRIEGAERVVPDSYLYFDYPTKRDPAVLVRTADGEYRAYSRKCAHQGCSVDFDHMRRCLNCPCHSGAYDAQTGSVLYGPPPRPLDQIILQMRAGGEVWAVGRTVGSNDNRASTREQSFRRSSS